MLPDFDENGNLPPGIHRCSFDEVVARFGVGSPEREAEADELTQLAEWATKAGVERILVDGSFVTSKPIPNDVDVVLLLGSDYPRDQEPAVEAAKKWPFVHVILAENVEDYDLWAKVDFASDRGKEPRGIVEVVL